MKTVKIAAADLVMLIALLLIVAGSSVKALSAEAKEICNNTLRLHMLANSDSNEDQSLKLKLRDALLAEYSTALAWSGGIDQAVEATAEKLPEIEAFLEQKALELGYAYPIKASLVGMHFDTRVYSDQVTMPAGYYQALRITIGEGKGQNWWCVMYPPLCIPAATPQDAKTIEDKIAHLNSNTKFIPKFAIIELTQELGSHFAPQP